MTDILNLIINETSLWVCMDKDCCVCVCHTVRICWQYTRWWVRAGVLQGPQRLFFLMASVGGTGTYVVTASSQRPLVQHICSDFLYALGWRRSDTGCSKESANILKMYTLHKFHSIKAQTVNIPQSQSESCIQLRRTPQYLWQYTDSASRWKKPGQQNIYGPSESGLVHCF